MYCTKSCQQFQVWLVCPSLHSIEVPATRHRHIFCWVVLLIANISKSVPYVLRRNKHFGAFFAGTSVFFCVKHIECGYDRGNESCTWNCKIFYLVVIQNCGTKNKPGWTSGVWRHIPQTKQEQNSIQVYQIPDAVCMEYLDTDILAQIYSTCRYRY